MVVPIGVPELTNAIVTELIDAGGEMNSEVAARYSTSLLGPPSKADRNIEPSPESCVKSSDTSKHKASESGVLERNQSGTEIDDEQLLARIATGDKEALSAFFHRYATMVRSGALRILRNSAEADDLVQEVFLFVYRKASLFDPTRGSARSWLVQVTYHRAFDRRRHLASRQFYTSIEVEEELLGTAGSEPAKDFYENSLEGTLGRETLDKIGEALSEDQKRVLHLYFFEGYSIEEIADLIGQRQGNVRNHYYRALEKMRRIVFQPWEQAK